MSTELKLRRDVEGDIFAGTPAEGEPIFDITNKRLVLGDASTVGGIPQARMADFRGYIDGLIVSTGTDTEHDRDIAPGVAQDDGSAFLMKLTATLTKQIDAAWAVGDDAGGMDTGAVAVDTWYHVWLIRRSDTGVVDALFSLSVSSPTMPTDYDQKRRIRSVFTDGSANILGDSQVGDKVLWDNPPADVNVSNQGTSAILYTLQVPTGLQVDADIIASGEKSAAAYRIYVSSPDADDEAPAETGAPMAQILSNQTSVDNQVTVPLRVRTNTSSQIRARGSAASTDFDVTTLGWWDHRGRDS